MNPLGISVVRADESYGYAKYYYYEGPTVYIEVTSINSSNSRWRVRGRESLGDDEIYLDKQGTGTFTFDSDDNMSYIFQIQNWNGDWVNTTNAYGDTEENSIIDVDFESDGGDSGDDDDDNGGSGGGSGSGNYYIYIYKGEGTSLKVERTWNETTQEDYEGSIYSGSRIAWKDYFDVTYGTLSGYENARIIFDNFYIEDTTYNNDGTITYHGTMDVGGNIRIESMATKIGGDDDDDGGSSGGNGGYDDDGSSGGSGSGTLYFDATQYGAQYAVDHSYDDNTFYIDSVKVKLAQYNSVWWAFNLTAKINDTVVSSGSQNHFIDTWDWYDLGISGSADVTDEVKVSLSGSAIHNNYQFNVASPTSQYVTTGNSGGGGNSGGDSGGSSSGTTSDTVTAGGVTAKATWNSSGKVTVTITSLGGYNAGLYWRVKIAGASGNTGIQIPETNSTSASFNATNGETYIFQICPSGTWTNDGGSASKFTVNFDSGSGGDSGGGGSNTATPRKLYVNQGEGTIVKVRRSWPDFRKCWDSLEPDDPIYCDGEDTFYIEVTILDGYEVDYYEFEGLQVPYILENFTYLNTVDDRHYYRLEYDADATVTSTATPISVAYIYNQNSGWERYAPYIYNQNSGWERYTPYIYNGSNWERYS